MEAAFDKTQDHLQILHVCDGIQVPKLILRQIQPFEALVGSQAPYIAYGVLAEVQVCQATAGGQTPDLYSLHNAVTRRGGTLKDQCCYDVAGVQAAAAL